MAADSIVKSCQQGPLEASVLTRTVGESQPVEVVRYNTGKG